MMRRMTCVTPPASPATEPMFQKILTSALIAGFGAGVLAAVLHLLTLEPLLLLAETYETGSPLAAFDLTRTALTVLFFALTYVGFALLLCAASFALLAGIWIM